MLPACAPRNSLKRLHATSRHLSATSVYSTVYPKPVSISTTSKMAMSLSTQRAPWRDILDSHLKQTSGYDFTIATVGLDSQGRFVPRVRTCGCRGFFPELELHPKGQEAMDEQVEGAGNPPVYESDMLSFTTDVRMEKLGQLEESGHAIEAIFWLEDVMTQWRVKGRAYAIGNPDPEETSELEMASQKEIMKGLRVKSNANEDTAKWTWEKAVTKYFANHSPIMRGSFKAPSPGQPRSKVPDDSELGLGQKVTNLHDPVARKNFRVVVILPEEVERLDLSNQEDPRRWKWTLVNDETGSHWVKTELWP